MNRVRLLVLAILALASALLASRRARADEPGTAVYDSVMTELGGYDQRLVGTTEYAVSLAKLRAILTRSGLVVHGQTYDTLSPKTRVARLAVGGRDVSPVYAPAPNGVAPPTSWGAPIEGPIVYVGDGSLPVLDGKALDGAIAVLEMDSPNAPLVWSQGVRAIVLVGDATTSQWLADAQFTYLPLGLPRLYVDRKAAIGAGLLLADGSQEASLDVSVTWERATATNLWVKIPGTKEGSPDDRPQALVLSATLDTFGAVPDMSPEQRDLANVALLAQVAANLKKQPLDRSVYAVFFGSHYGAQEGARWFYFVVGRAAKPAPEGLAARATNIYKPELEKPIRQLALLDDFKFVTASGDDAFELYLYAKRRLVAKVNDRNYALRERIIERAALDKQIERIKKGLEKGDVEALEAKKNDDLRKEGALAAEKSVMNALRGQLASKAITDKASFASIVRDLHDELILRRDYFERMLRYNDTFRELEAALKPKENVLEQIAAHFAFDFASADKPWIISPFGAHNWSRNSELTPGTFAKQLKAYQELYDGLPYKSSPAHLFLPDGSISFRFDALSTPHQRSVASMPAIALGIAGFDLATVGDALDQDGMPVRTRPSLAGLAPQMSDFVKALARAKFLPAKTDVASLDLTPLLVYDQSGDKLDGLEVMDLAKGSEELEGPARQAMLVLAELHDGLAGRESRYLIGHPDILIGEPGPTGHVFIPGAGAIFAWGGTPQRIHAFGFSPTGGIDRFTINGQSTGSRASLHYGYGGGFFAPFAPADYSFTDMGRWLVARNDSDARWKFNAGTRDAKVFYVDEPYPFKYLGNGLNVLGGTADDVGGRGLSADPRRMVGLDLTRQAASDYAELNLSRLETLRSRNIINKSLEKLQADIREHIETARDARAKNKTRLAAAHETVADILGNRVHQPVRDNVNDLVQAVVILMLLCMPFSFALERLVFGFTLIYKQIAGFVAIFLATFFVLYFTHPAFSLASAPIIVFLAFIIIVLSAFVITVVMGKFRQELRAMQGLSSKVHGGQAEGGTALAAVVIGISGMRNRPLKTFLTATTVALLTFTILVFASFTSSLGVVRTYLGAPRGAQRIEFHIPSFLELPRKLTDAITTTYADRYDVHVRGASFKDPVMYEYKDDAYNVARNPDTQAAQLLDAVLVVDPAEVPRLDPLFAPLGAPPADGLPNILISKVLAEKLGALAGATITMRGQAFRVLSFFDSQALKHLENIDGTKIVPPNFEATFAAQGNRPSDSGSVRNVFKGMDTNSFLYASTDLTAIATFSGMKKLAPIANVLTLYPKNNAASVEADARELAEFVEGPVFANGDEGAQRFFFTKAVEGSGALEVLVPLLLGGLIIFSSLLGSIVDRQREIFTFSALGLAPPDVATLFFAESAVFAILGGMGGYLISQLVVKLLSVLATYGLADVPDINFSSFSSIVTILIVMATVMLSTIYPAVMAGRSANPGVARKWRMPKPEGDRVTFPFPFTVSADAIGGILAFIREHFENHGDASIGAFAARDISVFSAPRDDGGKAWGIRAEVALAPFDLGVFQSFEMQTRPSDIQGIDEVVVKLARLNGAPGTWLRSNRAFIDDLREQFLRWRSLPVSTVLHYQGLADKGEVTDAA
jgi:hypothetical protein